MQSKLPLCRPATGTFNDTGSFKPDARGKGGVLSAEFDPRTGQWVRELHFEAGGTSDPDTAGANNPKYVL